MTTSAVEEFPRQYAKTRRFTTGVPRNLRIARDGELVTFLRSAAEHSPLLTLWGFDTTTGIEHAVVDLDNLDVDESALPRAERERRERARESAGGIVSYSLDSSRQRACFALGGELHVVDLASGSVTHIDTPGSVFDPKFSPDASTIAFVSGRSLFTVSADGSQPATLRCGEDDPLVSWGRAEFIAAEEMQRSAGYWWAPDSKTLIASRTDNTPVTQWWISDPAHPGNEPVESRYPAAGTANAIVSLWLVDIAGEANSSEINWSDTGEFAYLVDVIWKAGHEPLIVRQRRDQQLVDIVEFDPQTSQLTSRYKIRDDHWVEIFPGTPAWCGDRLLTIEDHGDTRSLYLDGERVSPADMQVRSLISSANDDALVTFWNEPSEVQLATINVATGEPTVLSDGAGVATGLLSESVQVTSQSTMDAAGTITTVHRDGRLVGQISSYATEPSVKATPRFRQLGERQLNSAILLPSWHDGVQPLPVLCDPYGGPHAQRVLKSQNAHVVSQWFAELGYAVVVADGRGTPGRGPAWERLIAGDLAGPVLQDQIDVLDAAKLEFPFLDLGRVGIRGWSFGGYLAALAVLKRPDRFHAALAGAPVTSWELYDTHYTERYLGQPDTDREAYDRSDLLRLPSEWDHAVAFPPLMLIHGLADDNVVAAHTLQLSSALLTAGLSHQVLPLTGVTHMTPQEVVAENLLRVQANFLNSALRPAPTEGI